MAEVAGGWGSIYNNGVGIQGGFGGTSTEYSTWAALLAAIQADDNDADNSPKIYVYTGPDVTLADSEVVNITGLNRKTIYANTGQTISKGEIRHLQCDDIIWRNWKRRGPYVPVVDQPAAKTDYFTFNECNGIWVDHVDMDAEFQYAGAGDEYPDGMIDINLSNYIVISNSRIWNGQRGILIGYGDNEAANIGLLNVTLRDNWIKNIGGRGPKCRFGMIHLYNNLGGNNPSWFEDWSPLNKPSGQHFGAHGAGAELYSENNWWDEGQSAYRDDDNSNDTSGLVIDGDYFGNFQYTGGTVSKRTYNVNWNPKTYPGYVYPEPVRTPADAKVYVEQWAGATWHLKDTTTYNLTLSVNNASYGEIIELSEGPYSESNNIFEVAASAFSGYKFIRFDRNDQVSSQNNPYSGPISGDLGITAIFDIDDSEPLPPGPPPGAIRFRGRFLN